MIADMVAYLESQTAISNIVSDRIYPMPLPQHATLPALTYTRISTVRTYSLEADMRKARARIQIDSWATTDAVAYQLARAVRHAMSGFYGSMSGTQVHLITIEDERDFFESQAGIVGLVRVSQDHRISHLED